MSKTTSVSSGSSGSSAQRPIPGLIHVTPSGAKERCRIQKRPCPCVVLMVEVLLASVRMLMVVILNRHLFLMSIRIFR